MQTKTEQCPAICAITDHNSTIILTFFFFCSAASGRMVLLVSQLVSLLPKNVGPAQDLLKFWPECDEICYDIYAAISVRLYCSTTYNIYLELYCSV